MKRTLDDIRANLDHVGCDNATALEMCDEIERLQRALEIIAGSATDKLQATQAKGALAKRGAYWTHDDNAAKEIGEHLYYFAPTNRAPPPYKTQRHVEAIIDVAEDGTLAGVELIDKMPPPPEKLPDLLVGPFKEWRVQVDGRIIPNLTGYRDGDKIALVVDGRFSASFSEDDARQAAWLIAQAMTVAEGYPHLGATSKEKPFAPMGMNIGPDQM